MTDHRPPAAQPSASLRTRDRFALTGHSPAVDPRVDAARGDLADIRLADRIFAPHYAAPVGRSAITRSPLLAALGGQPVSEVLKGERFDVLELSQGYAWGVSAVDGAVGFVEMQALGAPGDVTHMVCAPGAPEPMGSQLTAGEAAAFDPATIRPMDAPAKDFVTLAEALIGTAHAPGGRSSLGVDEAGIVVLVLSIAGIRAPRYVDLQATTLGHPIGGDAPMIRGDLIFIDDAVAIVVGDDTAVWCDGSAVARVPIAGLGEITVRRRLP